MNSQTPERGFQAENKVVRMTDVDATAGGSDLLELEAAGVEPAKWRFGNFLTTRMLWSQLMAQLRLATEIESCRIHSIPQEST